MSTRSHLYNTLQSTDIMHFLILASLAAATSAAPQIVPYDHVEIAAEPYVHQEISAEPYVHIEPELTAEALGIINRSQRPQAAPVAAPVVAPQQFAAPVQQFAQFVPQQQHAQFAPVQGVQAAWTGGCYNNLGEGVPCRQKFREFRPPGPEVATTIWVREFLAG